MKKKIKVETGTVQETLLLPLWGRAYESRQAKPRLIDNKADEILRQIDYDFSAIESTQGLSQHGWIARSLHTDTLALDFIEAHPEGTIVNIGCGLDTTFSRVDNGKIMFYELDLPEVIELRKNFYTDDERHVSIASSFLETDWFDDIRVRDGLLFLAGGVFCYFREEEMKDFFIKTAERFDSCEIYFDILSPKGMDIARKQVLKKGGMGMSLEDGWGVKSVKSLEEWDPRIRVISSKLMYKGMKKGMPLKARAILTIPDILGICSMVHIGIRS